MRLILLLSLLLLTSFLAAQNFAEADPVLLNLGTLDGDLSFSDIDGDNDQDLLFGSTLYTNDGTGLFTEVSNSPFTGGEGKDLFVDIDNDNDQDVLIVNSSCKLYTNDGNGQFTEMMNMPFESLSAFHFEFSDMDNDGDQDLLITDKVSGSDLRTPYLFVNDGTGNFSEVINTSLQSENSGVFKFLDADGDGDKDVLITAKLYINDGSGAFTASSTPIYEDIDGYFLIPYIADVDGDNDPDILIGFQGPGDAAHYRIYLNDGTGNFIENNSSFLAIARSITFVDVDGDDDKDIVVTTVDFLGGNPSVRLYINDGTGTYAIASNPFVGLINHSIAFTDLDSDGDIDIIMTGNDNNFGLWDASILFYQYMNDGDGNFSRSQPIFEGVYDFINAWNSDNDCSLDFVDIDGDNDLDVFITGNKFSSLITKLYRNNGIGGFSEIMNTPFTVSNKAPASFADIDGDNDLDLIIKSSLYLNNGFGDFTEVMNPPFAGINAATNAFTDIDGDGDQDVLVSSNLYLNDGSGIFTEVMSTPFSGINAAISAFVDIDGDSDQDLLINNIWYINDGTGDFVEGTTISFTGAMRSIEFADIDNDLDQDILIMGSLSSEPMKLYTNDGTGTFSEVSNTFFDDFYGGSIAFSDIDDDLDQDVIISGNINGGSKASKLYLNDGTGNFSELLNTSFEGVDAGTIAFADVDNDLDNDILVIGRNDTNVPTARLYINDLYEISNDFGEIHHPIFYDLNENGSQETGEPFYPFASVKIEPGNTTSNGNSANGGFSYQIFGDYTVAYNPLTSPDWILTSDSLYEVSLSSNTPIDTVFFGIYPTTIYADVSASLAVNNFRCNSSKVFNLYAVNDGTSLVDGTLWLEVDPNILNIDYIDIPDTIVAPNLYGWHFNNLVLGGTSHKQISLTIPGPPDFPLGESLYFQTYATYTDMTGSNTSESFEYSDIVECSYDPNDKLVNPVYPFNYALIGGPLTYTIRFQNTGNAEAFDVIIRDTLDSNLDVNTFQVIASSHDTILSTQLKDNQYLTLSFIDINLPDSTSNFEESQGFIMYRIQAIDTIPEETEIQNTASIYFDANPPIVTNTTTNTMVSSLDADEDEFYIWEDCDDNNAMINPDASEVCDDLDNDCNLQVDDDLPLTAYFLDADNDGFGNVNMPIAICDSIPPAGYVDNASDCDDNNSSVNPAATEIPNNGIDEDCIDGDLVVSISTDFTESQITIFPNPTSGLFLLRASTKVEGELSIKNYNGKTLLNQTFEQESQINLSGFTSGVYLVEIKTAKGIWVERVVKI